MDSQTSLVIVELRQNQLKPQLVPHEKLGRPSNCTGGRGIEMEASPCFCWLIDGEITPRNLSLSNSILRHVIKEPKTCPQKPEGNCSRRLGVLGRGY